MRLKSLLFELTPGEEAKRRGLTSIGFGRYADPSNPNVVVAKSVDGRLVSVDPKTEPEKTPMKKAPDFDPDFEKKIDGKTILGQKTGGPRGSNEGGFYTGTDGVERYVKFYKDANQGRSEYFANKIYNELGIGAPNSHLFTTDHGEDAYAHDIVPGQIMNTVGKTPEISREILKGFVADVLTANWDTVGLVDDNILVGEDGKIHRIDNGGTFTFRAQGGAKPEALLNRITEFDGFANPEINHEYSEVFRSAGIDGPDDPRFQKELKRQLRDILALRKRSGGWDKFVKQNGSKWNPVEQERIAEMLESRTRKLVDRIGQSDEESNEAKEFTSGKPVKGELNGVKFESWSAPKDIEEWKKVEGTNPNLREPSFDTKGKRASAGIIVEEPDGRIWLVEPSNHYGGYEHTFPKGGIEDGLNPQQSAIKEAYEESGLQVKIADYVGDFEGDTSMTRYYRGTRVGGTPSDHGWETQAVKLVPKSELKKYLNRSRDHKISRQI